MSHEAILKLADTFERNAVAATTAFTVPYDVSSLRWNLKADLPTNLASVRKLAYTARGLIQFMNQNGFKAELPPSIPLTNIKEVSDAILAKSKSALQDKEFTAEIDNLKILNRIVGKLYEDMREFFSRKVTKEYVNSLSGDQKRFLSQKFRDAKANFRIASQIQTNLYLSIQSMETYKRIYMGAFKRNLDRNVKEVEETKKSS